MFRLSLIVTVLLLATGLSAVAGLDPSYSEQAVIDSVPFYPGGTYDQSIPKPNDYFQYPIGQWPLRFHELIPYLEDIAAASDRVMLEKHAVTHEGRQLYNVFISSEANLKNLEQLRQRMDGLANLEVAAAEVNNVVADLPAVAWLGYSIHGDEVSGVDAAAQLIYQLAAGTDEGTMNILNNVVIIIDPCENPDGRERYLSMLQTYKSHVPNYNRRAMQHNGVWPWGRTNHYLFDLNRDWILLTQPETRGKVATVLKWHPQLVVDAHEMGSDETFLFSPPREPINYNIPKDIMAWYDVFAKDQSAAFDQRGWTYYTGEWNDQWYPGYGSAWATYFGAVGILYEMAGVDGQFVKQSDDYLLTYHEAVNKQFTSSLTNLQTLASNRKEMLLDYYKMRRDIVDRGAKSNEAYLFVPDGDELKTKWFIERLAALDIKVQRATKAFTAGKVTDIYGTMHNSREFPAGTYVVSLAQPHGALARAVLDFDPRLKTDFLQDERRELEKHGDTRMYEVSTWSVPLAYDMDAYRVTSKINAALEPVTMVGLSGGRLHKPDATVGFVIDMVGEKTSKMLAKLFTKDLVVYGSEKPFTIEGRKFAAGALFLRKRANRSDLPEVLAPLAEEISLDIYGVNTGASSEGSLLGAPTFRLLSKPKVAIVAGDGTDYTSFGALWFVLDRELEYPHSLVNLSYLARVGLDQYNVLILPGSWGPMNRHIDRGAKSAIEEFIEGGGTLICTGQASAWAADSSVGLSHVALRRQVLDKLSEYETAVDREIRAEQPPIDTMALWYPEKVPVEDKKEDEAKPGKVTKDEDEWQRKFSPSGVILRADLDTEDWLAFGMKPSVPVMLYSRQAFMSKPPVKTVARFAEPNRIRMSGLLWPEGT